MGRVAKPSTLDQALAFFDQAESRLAKRDPRPGENFFTAAEFAKGKGCAVSTAKIKLDRMVAEKLAEASEGRVHNSRTTYYRIFEVTATR